MGWVNSTWSNSRRDIPGKCDVSGKPVKDQKKRPLWRMRIPFNEVLIYLLFLGSVSLWCWCRRRHTSAPSLHTPHIRAPGRSLWNWTISFSWGTSLLVKPRGLIFRSRNMERWCSSAEHLNVFEDGAALDSPWNQSPPGPPALGLETLQTRNYSVVLLIQLSLLLFDLLVNSFSELLRAEPAIQLILFMWVSSQKSTQNPSEDYKRYKHFCGDNVLCLQLTHVPFSHKVCRTLPSS